MSKVIVCIGGRCSVWGKSWKKHLYSGNTHCLRCGIGHREQWEEDKAAGLVHGQYMPPPPARPLNTKVRNPDQIMYCAVGDEGIEFADASKLACENWIAEQEEDMGITDYYGIETFTKAELAAMPEV